MITLAFPIAEASQIADVRRRATDRARNLSLSELAIGQLQIIVTELATNLLKFAVEGTILVSIYEDEDGEGLQLLAIDRGPGMPNVARCLEDGYSTAGSSGVGLGAIRRLAHSFAIGSWASGTIIMARIGPGHQRVENPTWGMLALPLRGEEACGDTLCIRPHAAGWTAIAADGLGHGPRAADASVEAIRQFRRCEEMAPHVILERVHEGLRHTRGAAVAVGRLDEVRATIAYAGIGNISASIVAPGDRKQLVSLAGTAGHNARKITSFDYPFRAGSIFIMHSDGLSSTWSLEGYAGIFGAHPMVIIGLLLRDHARARDDVSVIVARRSAISTGG